MGLETRSVYIAPNQDSNDSAESFNVTETQIFQTDTNPDIVMVFNPVSTIIYPDSEGVVPGEFVFADFGTELRVYNWNIYPDKKRGGNSHMYIFFCIQKI